MSARVEVLPQRQQPEAARLEAMPHQKRRKRKKRKKVISIRNLNLGFGTRG